MFKCMFHGGRRCEDGVSNSSRQFACQLRNSRVTCNRSHSVVHHRQKMSSPVTSLVRTGRFRPPTRDDSAPQKRVPMGTLFETSQGQLHGLGRLAYQRQSLGAYLAVKVPDVPTMVRAVEVALVADWQLQSIAPEMFEPKAEPRVTAVAPERTHGDRTSV